MRVEGWEKRLTDYLEAEAFEAFEWGIRDCVLFAADICLLQTGIDPAEAARGRYSTKEEALQLLQEAGVTQVGIIDAHFKRIPKSFAQRGDVVYRRSENSAAFGVIYNGKAIYRNNGIGFVIEKISGADLAWRIE